MREKQWILFYQKILRQNIDVWAGWAECEVDWKLAERLGPVMLSPRGTLIGWRNELTKLHEVQQEVWSSALREEQSYAPIHARGSTYLRNSFSEKDLRNLLDIKFNVSQQCAIVPKKGQSFASSPGRWSLPSLQQDWGHAWSTVFSFGLPSTRETWRLYAY